MHSALPLLPWDDFIISAEVEVLGSSQTEPGGRETLLAAVVVEDGLDLPWSHVEVRRLGPDIPIMPGNDGLLQLSPHQLSVNVVLPAHGLALE